jgi:hypothetical protein
MAGKLTNPSVFRFKQDVASATWTVVHNLSADGGSVPIVDVVTADVDGSLLKIIPLEINVIDANTVQILFSTARTGTVVILL